jgi:hypothetical protein
VDLLSYVLDEIKLSKTLLPSFAKASLKMKGRLAIGLKVPVLLKQSKGMQKWNQAWASK